MLAVKLAGPKPLELVETDTRIADGQREKIFIFPNMMDSQKV